MTEERSLLRPELGEHEVGQSLDEGKRIHKERVTVTNSRDKLTEVVNTDLHNRHVSGVAEQCLNVLVDAL